MSFEYVEDIWKERFRPPHRVDTDGLSYSLCYLRPYVWGGRTKSGLYVDHAPESLPFTYGVLLAIRHESPHSILRLPRAAGGLMPGDLVHFSRHAPNKLSDIEFEHEAGDSATPVIVTYPLLVMHEDEILGRVDGVLPDPYAQALVELGYAGDTEPREVVVESA